MALSDQTIFYKPSPSKHVIIIYQNKNKLTDLVASFFNEGLQQNQLCIYASAASGGGILPELSLKIKDYEQNVQNENLIIVDLKPFYFSTMNHDLAPFEELKKSILLKKLERVDKHIRLYVDLASFLFEEKHFEQSFRLEQWCQNNPFGGTMVCPYRIEILDDPSYSHKKEQIIREHNNILLC